MTTMIRRRLHLHLSLRMRAVLVVIMLGAGLGVFTTNRTGAPAHAATNGSISGYAYRDVNGNGRHDTGNASGSGVQNDPPLPGVTVKAYDAENTLVGQTVTGSNGVYSLPIAGAFSSALRVEFTLSPAQVAEGYEPSAHGPQDGTSVQFVATGGQADFAAIVPEDHVQDGARAAVSIERANDPNQQPAVTPVLSSVETLPWDLDSTNASTPTVEASANGQAYGTGTGSVYGLAYQRGTDDLYTSAFLRRHSGLGPAGLGGIYKVDTSTHQASLLVDLTNAGIDVGQASFSAALGSPGPAGDNAARGLPGPVDLPSNDPVAWQDVGKYGLGGMAMSTDQRSLYVVNLFHRSLVKVDIATGTATEIGLGPLAADQRPFGVTVHRGKIYVGLVDTAETSGRRSDLNASVIVTPESSTGSWTDALAPVPLDFLRGPASTFPLGQLEGDIATHWNAWTEDFTATENAVVASQGQTWITRPEPLLTGLAFDVNGNLDLAFGDRHGFQTGTANYDLVPGDKTLYDGISEGDLLTAAPNAADTSFTLESNGVRGSQTGSATGDKQGPGGGEFYMDTSENYVHDETFAGAVATDIGYRDLLSTGGDLTGSVTSDVGWVPTDGASNWATAAQIVNNDASANGSVDATDGFGKANSLGGVAVLADLAPVEIGNRVWYDADGDGIQDADEPAVPGVTVTLTDAHGNPVKDAAGRPVGPVRTDAGGDYYFSNLLPNQTYEVAFDRSTADVSGLTSTFGITSPSQLTFTRQTVTAAGATTSNDSNPAPATGIARVDLGGPGQNDHTIDAGLVADAYLDVSKVVHGPGAPAGQEYTVTLACKDFRGDALAPATTTLTLAAGEDYAQAVPAGSSCTVTETDAGGADSTTYTVDAAAPVAAAPTVPVAGTQQHPTEVVITNTYNPKPAIDIVKYDGRATAPAHPVDGHDPVDDQYGGPTAGPWAPKVDADTASDAATYPLVRGTTGPEPVKMIVTNTGTDDLTAVAVADTTDSGPAVSGISCDFSALGGPSSGTTWAGPFKPGDSFPCSGTLTLGPSETHADTASVTATSSSNPHVTVGDEDQYHAATPNPGGGVDIEKFDQAFGTPKAYDPADVQHDPALDADTAAHAVAYVAGMPRKVLFAVDNTGQEDLVDVTVSDHRISGIGEVTGISCDFSPLGGPKAGTTWAGPLKSGAHFYCSGVLTLPAGSDHADRATVTATGAQTGHRYGDHDDFHATTPKVDHEAAPIPPPRPRQQVWTPVGPLPRTGVALGSLVLLGLALAGSGLLLSRRSRRTLARRP